MLLDDISIATRLKRAEADYFVYGTTYLIGVFIGAAVVANQIPVDADSDFIWAKAMLISYTAAGTVLANPDYLVTITDSGSGRNLQNQQVHVGNVFGTAQLPYILPEPKLIKASSVLTVTLQNLTAVAARVDISLGGFKLFYKAGYSRDMIFS